VFLNRRIKEKARAFYKSNLERWKAIGEDFPRWTSSSAPEYRDHRDLLSVFYRHLPGPKILGAGCGPVGRDVRYLARRGCKPTGIDFVEENIESARSLTAEEVEYKVADLTEPLPFEDSTFHGVLSIAVIQYLTRMDLTGTVLPSLARALVVGGVLLVIFKKGVGLQKVVDPKLKVSRQFRLYEPEDIIKMGEKRHLSPIKLSSESGNPWIDFEDGRGIPHSALLFRKVE
jgi:SAM-dependent methyltransferase